ncbi:energy transducer TonB [Luteimonas sp. 22616]|uniref:energy transducer TonB n=1 Tax=Luteimonas sp. 22616 TaxID=3453951 RepID=UPI003F848D60
MSSPANPPSPGRRTSVLGLSFRAWLYVAVAFALGVGLFLLIWAGQRGSDDYYRADSSHKSVEGSEFEPLPQPDSGDAGLDQPQPAPQDDATQSARIVETSPAPGPAPTPTAPAQAPAATAAGGATTGDTPPMVISSPPPVYPRAALRRRESGDVLLRVHVGADGVPHAVDLIRGSGSRYLDRAASDAVRKWRFRPAMRAGQPVSGQVQVPISFNPGR